jgi:hypothetical protein
VSDWDFEDMFIEDSGEFIDWEARYIVESGEVSSVDELEVLEI